jgi:hypothetical protein
VTAVHALVLARLVTRLSIVDIRGTAQPIYSYHVHERRRVSDATAAAAHVTQALV